MMPAQQAAGGVSCFCLMNAASASRMAEKVAFLQPASFSVISICCSRTSSVASLTDAPSLSKKKHCLTELRVGPFFIFCSVYYFAPHSWFQSGQIPAVSVSAGELCHQW